MVDPLPKSKGDLQTHAPPAPRYPGTCTVISCCPDRRAAHAVHPTASAELLSGDDWDCPGG